MALPGDLSTFTLRFGEPNGYTDATGALALVGAEGELFTVDPSTNKPINVKDTLTGHTILPKRVPFTVGSDGKASVTPVPHTGQARHSPAGWALRVEWKIASGDRYPSPKNRTFVVPSGATAYYDSLVPAETIPAVAISQPTVASVNGQTGAVSLDAADVGAATPAALTAGLAGKQDAATLNADTAALVDAGTGALPVALRAASVAVAGGGILVGNAIATDSATPIIPVGTGSDWDTSIREIGNVVWDGTQYRMLYTGHTGANAGNNVYVGLATSPDGVTWTKQGRLTGITRASEDPYLVRVDGVWHLFVEDKEEVPFKAIRKYHSTDFVTWVDDGQVLTPGAAAWETQDVSSPVVWVDVDGWHMLYEGRNNSGGFGSTGYATSPDGLAWTRHPANPVLSSATVPWATQVVPDDHFVLAGRHYLTAHTHDGIAWGVALAVALGDDLSRWRELFGVAIPVDGLPAGVPDSVMAAVTPDDQMLLTFGGTAAGGIFRGSLVTANTAGAIRFTPTEDNPATTVQAAIEALTPVAPGQYMTGLFAPGYYYASPGGRGVVAAVAGQLTAVPFFAGQETELDRLGCEITAAAAGAVVRLGIYRDNGHGLPSDLVLDAGTVNAGTVGPKEVVSAAILTPGLYWLAGVAQGGAPSLRCVSSTMLAPTPSPNLANVTSGAPRTGLSMSGITGVLPATFVLDGVVPSPYLVAFRAKF